jgi:diamine N-acetyltransferase
VSAPVLYIPTVDEAEVLAQLGAQTFRDTWRHLYAPDVMDAYLAVKFSAARIVQELGDPDIRYWVVKEPQGAFIGYVKAAPLMLPVENAPPCSLELQRLYVSPDYKRSGIGRRLLAAFEDYAIHKKAPAAFTGVWVHNSPARALYEGVGFRQVGEYYFPMNDVVDESVDLDLILRKDYI